MKRVAITVVCAAMCSTAVFAQSGAAGQTMDKAMKEATLTGCVAEGTGGHYMLNNAVMGAADMKTDMKEAPKAEMKADMKPMSYQLMGGELKAHVGHKVTVTGTMPSAPMAKGAAGDKEKMDTAGTTGMATAPMVTVKSVKMVSASCQ